MTTLYDLRSQIVADLRQHLPTASINPHAGKFDLIELDKYGVKQAEVRVAVIDVPITTPPQRLAMFPVKVAAYVIARGDAQIKDADQRGLLIASSVLSVVRTYGVGKAVGGTPEQIGWTNLYSSTVNARGVSLSAVTWMQKIDLTPEDAPGALADFLTLYAAYDIPGDESPQPQDQIQLPQ